MRLLRRRASDSRVAVARRELRVRVRLCDPRTGPGHEGLRCGQPCSYDPFSTVAPQNLPVDNLPAPLARDAAACFALLLSSVLLGVAATVIVPLCNRWLHPVPDRPHRRPWWCVVNGVCECAHTTPPPIVIVVAFVLLLATQLVLVVGALSAARGGAASASDVYTSSSVSLGPGQPLASTAAACLGVALALRCAQLLLVTRAAHACAWAQSSPARPAAGGPGAARHVPPAWLPTPLPTAQPPAPPAAATAADFLREAPGPPGASMVADTPTWRAPCATASAASVRELPDARNAGARESTDDDNDDPGTVGKSVRMMKQPQ